MRKLILSAYYHIKQPGMQLITGDTSVSNNL